MMILVYIISFFIQSNVIICGDSDVYHVDPNCEGLSNCKSKKSFVSITSLPKRNRLCRYENDKVLICGNSGVFHKDENCKGLRNCKSGIKKVDLSSVVNSKKFCGWESNIKTNQLKTIEKAKVNNTSNGDYVYFSILFIALLLIIYLTYLGLDSKKSSLKNKKDNLEDRLSDLERNRFDESKVNEFINAKIEELEKKKFSSKIQILKNIEHISYLESKLTEAKGYIIITSGWISKSVVDDRFVELLKRKIQQNVKVLFVYGYKFNSKHNGSDDMVIKRLKEISIKSNGCFLIKEIPSSKQGNHSKCLIFDNKEAAIGSFNWLSTGKKSYNVDKSVIIKDSLEVKKEAIHFLNYFDLTSWANS